MPTDHLVSLLSVGSFFSLQWILEAKTEAKRNARKMILTSGDTTINIVKGPLITGSYSHQSLISRFVRWSYNVEEERK